VVQQIERKIKLYRFEKNRFVPEKIL
jgi:hypothetical protein